MEPKTTLYESQYQVLWYKEFFIQGVLPGNLYLKVGRNDRMTGEILGVREGVTAETMPV